MSKVYLQPKFNKLANVAQGKALQFNSSNVLTVVNMPTAGVRPQIKVTGTITNASCKDSNNNNITGITYNGAIYYDVDVGTYTVYNNNVSVESVTFTSSDISQQEVEIT